MPPQRSTRARSPKAAAASEAEAAAPAALAASEVEMRAAEEEEEAKVHDAAVGDAYGDDAGDDPSTSTSSSDSDSDSDFEEVDASEEDAAALSTLEEEMAASSASSYENHLQFISLLRKCWMTQRLRAARRAAAAAFPLPESIWLDWIEEEKKEASKRQRKAKKKEEEEQKSRPAVVSELVSLHEAAVADFLSVPLWASYLQTLREFDAGVASFTLEGAERFRDVAVRALAVAGLHVGRGKVLWRAARAFELDALEASSGSATAAAAAADSEARARSLWHSQLSTPLLYDGEEEEERSSNEAVRKELIEWEKGRGADSSASLPPHLAAADAAAAAASARFASEEAVSPSSSAPSSTQEELLAAHLAYLRLEERALASGKGGGKRERASGSGSWWPTSAPSRRSLSLLSCGALWGPSPSLRSRRTRLLLLLSTRELCGTAPGSGSSGRGRCGRRSGEARRRGKKRTKMGLLLLPTKSSTPSSAPRCPPQSPPQKSLSSASWPGSTACAARRK